ncbi:DUF2079 domain-containing protein [Candidatus Gracilibacteria bacterium]|nr:DUF2079 domain-containing protein [Candidatus Gracilibacteria bacterium]
MNKLIILAGIAYGLLSLIPHFNFQTNAFDMGIFNQTIQQYANGVLGPNTVRSVPILLADHLELLLFIFSPLYWLFGSYTLLIVQIAATLFGGYGVYLFVKNQLSTHQRGELIALTAAATFFMFFGLLTALAFDYHNNVVGIMFLPWMMYFSLRKKYVPYYFMLALLLISKENMGLISAFWGISLLFEKDHKAKLHGLITFLVSGIYVVASLKIIAALNTTGQYDHWQYSALGSSPTQALLYIITHPLATLGLLFNDPIKIKVWILLMLSGGIFVIGKPRYALLLIPIIAQKFLSDMPSFWGYAFHYSVEFAPIIAIGAALAIGTHIKNKRLQLLLLSGLLISNVVILTRIHFYNGESLSRLFTPTYYTGPSNKDTLVRALDFIQDAPSVSAQNTIVPHLKNRNIYLYPEVKDSNFIVLNSRDTNSWPLTATDIKAAIGSLQENTSYKKVFDEEEIMIFERLIKVP